MDKTYKQYNSVDLFKFLFAVVVVMIHTTPFLNISETLSYYFSNTVCNLAVPFFFVASGFLFFDKLDGNRENERHRLIKYIKHIFKMYVVWCIIWIPWKVLNFLSVGVTITGILDYLRDIVLVSGGDALWYLPALILSVAIIYWLYTRLQSPKVIVAIAVIPYIIGVIISSWYGVFGGNAIIDLYYKIFKTVDNGFLYGVMFVSIGLYIAKVKPKSVRWRDILCFSAALIAIIAEAIFITHSGFNRAGECNLLTLPIAIYYLFKIVLSINLNENKIYGYLRDYSTLIYLSHCFIIRTLKLILAVFNISVHSMYMFVFTLVIAMIFAIIVRYFAKERYLKFFKLLY